MQPIIRPNRAAALVAFIKKYVEDADSTFEAIHKTVTARLGGGNIRTPKPAADCDFDLKVNLHASHGYNRDYQRDLNADLERAFAALITESARQPGLPDVVAEATILHSGRTLHITLSVDYFAPAMWDSPSPTQA